MASVAHDRSRKTDLPLSRVCLLSREAPLPFDAKPLNDRQSLSTVLNSVLYGLLNAIRLIPTMYGYAAIMFAHPTFSQFLPLLSKIVLFSSAIHQVFCTFMSTIPGAIGQVHYLSLIFFSAMTTSICTSLHDTDEEDIPIQAKVVTSIVTISIGTIFAGVTLISLGQFKLATIVSYLPMPVTGGYLAYTGLFCFYTAAGLSTGVGIHDFTSFFHLLHQFYNIILCLPGFFGGTILFAISKKCHHPLLFSSIILLMPLVFYLMLLLNGTSMDEARESGWLTSGGTTASIPEILSLFDYSIVYWSQIPKQFTAWFGMVFIVAFSSSLNVVAIEIDTNRKFDINHELKTIGWANIVSGVFGGYAGSYNFEQTMFTNRSETNSRLVGVSVILTECLFVLLPLSVMSYVPRFFIAAILIFVALDLMSEWLVLAYQKMSIRECMVIWLTFLFINYFLLEWGIVFGVAIASLNFTLSYASVPAMSFRPFLSSSRQNVGESIVGLRPRFSAAAPMIGDSVINIRPYTSFGVRNVAQSTTFNLKKAAVVHFEFCGYLFFGSVVQILHGVQKAVYVRTKQQPSTWKKTQERASSLNSIRASIWDAPVECLDGSPSPDETVPPTEFIVMDFTRVSGMDATAARSAFLVLHHSCTLRGIGVLFASVHPAVRNLLLKNQAATETSFYVTADAALDYCATQILSDTIIDPIESEPVGQANEPISLLLHRYLNEPETSNLLEGIDAFFRKLQVSPGHEFYRMAEASDHLYFLARGLVTLFVKDNDSNEEHLTPLQAVLPGSMFGETFFFSQQIRQTTAIASQSCIAFEMSRHQFEAMKAQAPSLSVNFLDVIVQSILK